MSAISSSFQFKKRCLVSAYWASSQMPRLHGQPWLWAMFLSSILPFIIHSLLSSYINWAVHQSQPVLFSICFAPLHLLFLNFLSREVGFSPMLCSYASTAWVDPPPPIDCSNEWTACVMIHMVCPRWRRAPFQRHARSTPAEQNARFLK